MLRTSFPIQAAFTLMLGASLALTAGANAQFIVNGDSPPDGSGSSVSGAGDVNNDGYDDVIVGAPGDNAGAGLSSGSADVLTLQGPAVLIQALIIDVNLLNLSNGIRNGLDAKLDAALNALDDLRNRNYQAAVSTMEAFIAHVQSQSGRQIPTADADALVRQAQFIIYLIQWSS